MAYDPRKTLSGSMTPNDTPDPPVFPKGHYYGTILRYQVRENVQVPNNRGGTTEVTIVDFTVGNLQPAADVDPSRLEDIDLATMELTKGFWYNPSGMAELRDFIWTFKLPNASYDSLYPEIVGRRVLCTASPGTYRSKRTNKDIPITNLVTMVAVPDEATTDLSGGATLAAE